MAGILSKDQIIEQKAIEDALNSIATNVAKVSTAFDLVATNAHKLTTELGGSDNLNKLIKTTKDISKNTEELTFNQSELAKQHQELGKLTAKLDEIKSHYNKEIQKTKILIKEENEAIKDEITGKNAALKATKDLAEAKKNKAIEDRKAAAATKLAATEEKLKIAIESQAVGSIKRLQAENTLSAFTIKNKLNPAIASERAEILRLNQVIGTNKDTISDMQRKNVTAWERVTKSVWQHVAAYIGLQQAIQLGREIFNQTKELDQLAFGMRTVIKSSVELAQSQKYIAELAVNYGGDLITLTEKYIRFRAASVQSNMSALETQKIYTSASKAAGVMGLRTDQLSNAYLAIEQMLSKGKITTEELRRQLGDVLPGSFGIMAKALGLTIPELDKMLKKGEILSNEALPKFAVALEKAYGIENLKKIDTMAAAQGRYNTEVTGLIKEMNLSGTFKSFLNGLSSVVGFVKDHIVGFGRLVKVVTIVSAAYVAHKMVVGGLRGAYDFLTMAKKTSIIVDGIETVSTTRLTIAKGISTRATNIATAAQERWNLATKANVIGVVITALIALGAIIWSLIPKTKKLSEEMIGFNEEVAKENSNIERLYRTLNSSKKGTDSYKEAMSQLNDIALKYNATLLTENNSLDENNRLRGEIAAKMDYELRKKRYSIESDANAVERDKVIEPTITALTAKFRAEKGSDDISVGAKLAAFRTGIMEAVNEKDIAKNRIILNKLWNEFGAISDYYNAIVKFTAKQASTDKYYKQKEPNNFLLDNLKNAKDEFETNEKLMRGNKLSGTNVKLEDVYSKGLKDYNAYLDGIVKSAGDFTNKDEILKAVALIRGEDVKDPKSGDKGNKYTKLEELQDVNKQILSATEKAQQDLLATKNLSDDQLIQADQDNKKELLQIRLWQIEEEKKLVTKNKEETGKLNDEKAKVEMELSKTTADFVINERKRLEKEDEDKRKLTSESFMGDTEHGINNESIRLTLEAQAQILRVKNDKDAADKIRDIELQLSLDILKYRKQEYEAALLSNKLTEEDKKRYKVEIDRISLDIAQSGVDKAKQGSKTEVKDKKEQLRDIGEAVNEAANFGQQIFSNEAESAKRRYDDETKMAGDNEEAKIIAKRKYEAEDLKIRKKQDIADKAQAIFNIGLQLYMASASLNAFQVIAATLAIAAVLAKPVPQYFKGKVGTPETFIAGDTPTGIGASELIELQSGESFLTPAKPTLFSDPKFKGATVFPNFHDKTQAMLQNYSVNQGANIFLDMSKSEKSLDIIARNTKNKDDGYFNARGKQFLKRGSVVTELV